ncbi:valine--tRNA ligase [Spirochaetia bacterium]|nr:valine--tRNA ligase [Spirochaetia bacterium]
MKAVELEKSYDPKHFEDRIYALWREKQAFEPAGDPKKPPFVIVIPPPNVTGVLHLGHGLVISLIDIAIRFHRMKGEPTLWVPGTDHAGIATQHVVEKRLKAQGQTRHDLGRERFIAETWKIKEEHHRIISEQIAKTGSSVDWSRERFTMDEGLSRAVRDVFVTLYERDLLYKGNYLVNWCPSCSTALSDDEVEHTETNGKLYHIRYRLSGTERYVEIATTRPETLLGDTALAVNPDDERYRDVVGKMVDLPLTDRKIPVIADRAVDIAFGTGVLKVTPAHAPEDWDIAGRHDLPVINILNPDGTLNDAVPEKYRGLTVESARDAVLADLKAGDFYVSEEDIVHAVGHCYRCDSVIEPFLSEQWFVRMHPLADKALAAWRNGEITFYPRKWEHTYEHWLTTIRDWCISRQIWWGHRIPAWTCKKCAKLIVSRTDPEICPQCGSSELSQDPDVLDTWFSSWLWPFSTLGWPDQTTDLEQFYPTTTLITAYDIIFFWVSRMIMAGLEFTGKTPFRDIYIHSLIRDEKGRKMSKSLGNGIDPLDVVNEYGADALKFTLAFLCAQGQDILLNKDTFKIGGKFANKIWNASRYILMNLEGRNLVENPALVPADIWIYSRLNRAAQAVNDALLSYRYNDAAQTVYEYFWNDFCDWYVEATKLSLKNGEDPEKDRVTTILLSVLSESLRLLHPFLPFITEEIYQQLPTTDGLLILAPYPDYTSARENPAVEEEFAYIQDLIRIIRTFRSESTIAPEKKIKVQIRADRPECFSGQRDLIQSLASINDLKITGTRTRPAGSIGLIGTGFEAFIFVTESVDKDFLIKKFTKELERDDVFTASVAKKLRNEQFLTNAPPELVEGEKQKLAAALKRTETLRNYLADMQQ